MGTIRAILAISVVLAHCSWLDSHIFVGGQRAVQIFYMISGFLISHVLNLTVAYRNPLRFYASRGLRLYPVYYVVLVLTFVASLVANPGIFQMLRDIPVAATLLLSFGNLFLLGQDWVMFAAIEHGSLVATTNYALSEHLLYKGLLVPQAWTLGLELSFYIIAPFVLRQWPRMLALTVASLTIKVYLVLNGLGFHDPWTYRFFPAELVLFMLGAMSQRFLLPFWQSRCGKGERLSDAATAFLAVFCILYFIIPLGEEFKASLLIVVFVLLLPLTFIYQNKTRIDSRLGELSYPIYIGHILVIWTVTWMARRLQFSDVFVITAVSVAGVIIFAMALNRFVAHPVESIRQRLKS